MPVARVVEQWLGDAGDLQLTHQGIDRSRAVVRVRGQGSRGRCPYCTNAPVDALGEGIVLVLRVVPEVRHVFGANDC